MKESIIDRLLCSIGYLPPRNEEEMVAFENIYSKVEVDENFHVDVDGIVNGGCQYKAKVVTLTGRNDFSQDDLRMVARNFEGMPKGLVEKLKNQHKDDDDKGE
jgi:hypothetical protein